MRREISVHWGVKEFKDRKAIIYVDTKAEHFEVDYYLSDDHIETREMITEDKEWGETVHSLSYAESAAENYCLGYMQVGDGRKQ